MRLLTAAHNVMRRFQPKQSYSGPLVIGARSIGVASIIIQWNAECDAGEFVVCFTTSSISYEVIQAAVIGLELAKVEFDAKEAVGFDVTQPLTQFAGSWDMWNIQPQAVCIARN